MAGNKFLTDEEILRLVQDDPTLSDDNEVELNYHLPRKSLPVLWSLMKKQPQRKLIEEDDVPDFKLFLWKE